MSHTSSPSSLFRSIESGIRNAVATPGESGEHLSIKLDVTTDFQFYGASVDHPEGVFLATGDLRPLGTVVSLELHLPWGESVMCDGEVKWQRRVAQASLRQRAGMGIAFVNLSPDQLALLKRTLVLHPVVPIPADAIR